MYGNIFYLKFMFQLFTLVGMADFLYKTVTFTSRLLPNFNEVELLGYPDSYQILLL